MIEPEPYEGRDVFAAPGGRRVYHDSHKKIPAGRRWPNAAAALADGYRPCRVCKPGR